MTQPSDPSQLPTLSVVVPVFNEAGNVRPLAEEIVACLRPSGRTFELVFVNDASTDETAALLAELESEGRLRCLHHSINAGQSAAVCTGFQAARGEWVATLDGDGQNDPADLPGMLARALSSGVDCVTGVRKKRRDVWLKRISSKIANGFRNWITGDRVTDSGCGIRVVRRAALREIPVFNGTHRSFPRCFEPRGSPSRNTA